VLSHGAVSAGHDMTHRSSRNSATSRSLPPASAPDIIFVHHTDVGGRVSRRSFRHLIAQVHSVSSSLLSIPVDPDDVDSVTWAGKSVDSICIALQNVCLMCGGPSNVWMLLSTSCPFRERDVRSFPTAEDTDSYCHGSNRMEQFVLPQCTH